jgi:putative ABC transport system substrate-binding protein
VAKALPAIEGSGAADNQIGDTGDAKCAGAMAAFAPGMEGGMGRVVADVLGCPPLEPPTNEQEYQRVFAALAQEDAEGLAVNDESENVTHRRLIVELAAKGRLPAIYTYRQFVEAGGLMSYGVDASDIGHRVADLADKILKGAKPGEMPIFQPTKFELSINLKTAKTLGIALPPLLVARADNVFE